MGPGIAQVFLMGGHEVALTDIKASALDAARDNMVDTLALIRGAGLPNGAEGCLDKLTLTTDLAAATGGAALVIEAVPESLDIKKDVYAQLLQVCESDAVVASNTSAFPLPVMMPQFCPGRFLVAHFFNPPAIVPLVEIVRDANTDDTKVIWLRELLEQCGKKPVVLNGFVKGFLINRLQTALAREALYLYGQGLVSAQDLDTASVIGIGFKSAWQGFFETMDYIGLDTVSAAYQAIYPDLCNNTSVPDIVGRKVAEGKLGLKTGEGFLKYTGAARETEQHRVTVLLEQLKLYEEYK